MLQARQEQRRLPGHLRFSRPQSLALTLAASFSSSLRTHRTRVQRLLTAVPAVSLALALTVLVVATGSDIPRPLPRRPLGQQRPRFPSAWPALSSGSSHSL